MGSRLQWCHRITFQIRTEKDDNKKPAQAMRIHQCFVNFSVTFAKSSIEQSDAQNPASCGSTTDHHSPKKHSARFGSAVFCLFSP